MVGGVRYVSGVRLGVVFSNGWGIWRFGAKCVRFGIGMDASM